MFCEFKKPFQHRIYRSREAHNIIMDILSIMELLWWKTGHRCVSLITEKCFPNFLFFSTNSERFICRKYSKLSTKTINTIEAVEWTMIRIEIQMESIFECGFQRSFVPTSQILVEISSCSHFISRSLCCLLRRWSLQMASFSGC